MILKQAKKKNKNEWGGNFIITTNVKDTYFWKQLKGLYKYTNYSCWFLYSVSHMIFYFSFVCCVIQCASLWMSISVFVSKFSSAQSTEHPFVQLSTSLEGDISRKPLLFVRQGRMPNFSSSKNKVSLFILRKCVCLLGHFYPQYNDYVAVLECLWMCSISESHLLLYSPQVYEGLCVIQWWSIIKWEIMITRDNS